MSLGERLKEERERLALTQTTLGELVGAAKRTVIDWEKGTSSPTGLQLEAMARNGIDIQYTVTGARSRDALTAEEIVVLERYRAAPSDVRAAALGALIGGTSVKPTASKKKQVFHGDVGQNVKVDGNLDQRGLKISIGKKGKGRGDKS